MFYVQNYASIKITFDATENYLFDDIPLEILTFKPAILEGIQHHTLNNKLELDIIQKNNLQSLKYCKDSLKYNQQKNFKVREEYRVPFEFFQRTISQEIDINLQSRFRNNEYLF